MLVCLFSAFLLFLVTQVFVGGLDPSVDKETLEKLFSMVPNMTAIEMDYDQNNNFRVFFITEWIMDRELLLFRILLVLMLKMPLPNLTTKNSLSTI